MNIPFFFQNIFLFLYRNVFWVIQLFSNCSIFIIHEIIKNTHYNIDHLPLHLLILTIFIVAIIYIYIKLKYPFWNTQPVYHTYDFWRGWYSEPFLIQSGYPTKTRFCNFEKIKTIHYLELSDIEKKNTVNLIQSYSIPDESAIHMFNLGNLDTYMTGQSYTSFISLYFEETFIPLPKSLTMDPLITDQTIIDNIRNPIGCITSRAVHLYMDNIDHMIYFLDFITVNREKNEINLNISRELIQTHEYNQRKKNMDTYITEKKVPIQKSIFKKEVGLSEGVIPLVSYTSSLCYIHNERLRKLPPHFILVPIHRRNIQLLLDFIDISKTKYKCFGIPEVPNLLELIHSNIIKVFIIQKGSEIYSVYFFRDSRTQFENKGALLILCGSIRNTRSIDLFYMGFLHALRNILKQTNIFKILLIERISQNNEIYERYINKIVNPLKLIGENQSAYYLYNYVIPKQPFSAESCFIVF